MRLATQSHRLNANLAFEGRVPATWFDDLLPPEIAQRTRDALRSRIGKILDAFKPDECANYLAHAGYAST